MTRCLFISHFHLEGLGSSSIWKYQVFNICFDSFHWACLQKTTTNILYSKFNWFINDLFHFLYNYSFTHEGSSGTKLKIVSGSSHCACCYDNGTIKRFGVGLGVGD